MTDMGKSFNIKEEVVQSLVLTSQVRLSPYSSPGKVWPLEKNVVGLNSLGHLSCNILVVEITKFVLSVVMCLSIGYKVLFI